VDFYLYEHTGSDVVELIGYNTGMFLEFEHLFLVKSILYNRIAKDASRRLAQQASRAAAHHSDATAAAPHHLPPTPGQGHKGGAPHDQTHLFGHGHGHGHGHAHGHATPGTTAAEAEDKEMDKALGLVEIMDLMAGEYVMEHVVYINGNSHRPPSIKFVSDLPELDDGSEAPFLAARPEECRQISRPLNKRDRALLDAQQNGQTLADIARLSQQAHDYITRAAKLLDLDLNPHHAAQNRAASRNKLLGMMDHDDLHGGEAEDPNWATPTRHIRDAPASAGSGSGKHRGSAGHLPSLPNAHQHEHEGSSPSTPRADPPADEHLPPVTHPEAVLPKKTLLSSPSGILIEGHSLHKVFTSYASEKFHHNELNVFDFKKMCRESHLINAKFTTGSAEAAFRKTLLSAEAVAADGAAADAGRITFPTFTGALLKLVAHERACLYDQVVNTIVNSYNEQSDAPAI
jgi:hypothetical protein